MYDRSKINSLKIHSKHPEKEKLGYAIPMAGYLNEDYDQGKYGEEVLIRWSQFMDMLNKGKAIFDPKTVIILGAKNNTGLAYPEHINLEMEMMYMLEGQVTNFVNHIPVTIQKGDLLITKKGALHSTAACNPNDVAVNLIIPDTFFDLHILYYFLANPWFYQFYMDQEIGYLHCRAFGDEDVCWYMENLLCEFMDSDEVSVLNISLSLSLIINLYYRLWKKNGGRLDKPAHSHNELNMKDIYNYLQENIKSASLKDMAQKLSYSESYISRFIKKQIGKSFTALKNTFCVKKAMKLLETTDMSISAIIEEVGYGNSAWFYRLFESETGMNPTQYRQYKKDKKEEK